MDKSKAALRKDLAPLRRAAFCKKLDICRLTEYPEFISAETVFCYVSAHGEVDTLSLLKELTRKKTVVVPFCTDSEGDMICVKIESPDNLKKGRFGIMEPANPVPFPKEKIDFSIVPGLAFDREGYRLGYGKGYYDRFLADVSSFKLGVCDKNFMLDSLPHNAFDIKMDDVLLI